MTRKAYVYKLKPGTKDEYKRRHDNIWPELSELITKQGLHNYTIWFYDDLLFAYYELDEEVFNAFVPTKEEEEINARWGEYTSDLIQAVLDPATGEPLELECVFLHK